MIAGKSYMNGIPCGNDTHFAMEAISNEFNDLELVDDFYDKL